MRCRKAGMSKRSIINNGYDCVKMMIKADPAGTCLNVGINVIYAFSWMAQTVVLQYFFDTAQKMADQECGMESFLKALAVLGGVYLLYHVLDGISNCYSEMMYLRILHKIKMMIFGRIGSLNAIKFEDTEYLNTLEKVKNGAESFPGLFFTVIDILFYYIPYFIFMGWYLFRQSPVLAVSVIIVFIPAMASKLAASIRFKELEEIEAPLRRETEYYAKYLSGREYMKETRIYGASDFFEDKYESSLSKQNYYWTKVVIRQNFLQLMMKMITACGYGVIIGMLFFSLVNAEITMGVFTAVLATMSNLFRFMDKMILERFGWAAENFGAVENFFDFVKDAPGWKPDSERPSGEDLVLKHVNFSYPNVEKRALEDINVRIRAGETVAVVGENGSGKSTLAKLLTGLYRPTEGQISCGDKNLKEYSYGRVSGIFQKFGRYQMKLKENITIADQLIEDEEKLQRICGEAGIAFENVSLETMLGREFDGTDISGGQWQRIAIARGMYKDHDMIILDEPTAAIDPIEETEIYKKFGEICRGKTTILITHRLGAARLADRILVLKEGHIVQDGTWEQLLHEPGTFCELYTEQKHWYQERG